MTFQNPNTLLFDTYAKIPQNSRILVCNVSDLYFLMQITAIVRQMTLLHRDIGVLHDLRKRLARYKHVQVSDSIFPQDDGLYDVALLALPKGRELSQAMMGACLQALCPTGMLFVAGASKGGAKTAHSDLQSLVPSSRVLGNKARHRIFSALRPDGFVNPWHHEPQKRTFHVFDKDYSLYTHPGIFSYDHLDEGTAFLLAHLHELALPEAPRLLDAGCGVGIVGMVAERELNSRKVVWVDSDLLAVRCVQKTLPTAPVIAADLTHDLLAAHSPFDAILCNPPFHKEHEKSMGFMRSFARRAREMLVPGGRLVIVFNSFLPYWEVLEEHFAEIEFIADDGRFQILAGKHPD